ncbi:DNA-binding response regulator [Nitrospira sp. KM1]|uniref:response regulator n=1 Tax=Nitrospira sp. KM1 TaxID=1936990 RepID=UPI0013A72C3A|nr:response regulator transcription factor [Nitrospira sp. KM1]BCA54508.1 DNA-binding response regulator [Nitrospira sp. KM1]
MTLPRIRLFLVDDHEVVRLGLRELFNRSEHIIVIGDCATASQAITDAVTLKPDVVLMDLRLQEGSGVEACREIRDACRNTRVLFFTSFGDEEAVLSTTLAGASGYLMKHIDGSVLIDAVERVARGHSIIDPRISETILTRIKSLGSERTEDAIESLSPQELRILPLLAEGRTNKEIAIALGLSDTTVKSYLHRMFQKLHVSRRSQAAVLFSKTTRM